MASISTSSLPNNPPANAANYRGLFTIMTLLFFMWGFMTVFNDILISRFKVAFTLKDPAQLSSFLSGNVRQVEVLDLINLAPRPPRKVTFDSMPRMRAGLFRLGKSEAIALGAHAFAIKTLDRKLD